MIDTTVLAELVAFAELCDFPCTKQELLEIADDEDAPDEVLDILEDIPNREYESETDLVDEAQKIA